MTMAVDSSQQRYLNNFDHMNSYSHHAAAAAPHFTNPWTTQSGAGSQHQQQHQYGSMPQPQHQLGGIDSLRHHQPSHQTQHSQQHHSSHSQHAHPQLPQPTPQHHAAPHHAQHSPVNQHSQQPHHSQPQSQAPRQQQPVQAPPRPPSQQPLPPAPTMHRNGSMSYPTGANGMTVTAGGSPHSRDYRNDLLIATTSSGYDSNIAAYSAPTASPIHPTTNAAAAAYATATGATPYDQMGYAPATTMRGAPPAPTGSVSAFGLDAAAADAARRFSQDASQDNRRGFQDALEASQGMMSLNSQDTPRPLGFPGAPGQQAGLARSARGSADSYGFPSTAHSTSSSVSSQSFGGFYTTGGSSIDSQSNISDYSGSDIEQVSSRRMMHGGLPPHGHGHGMHSAAPQTHRPPPFVGSVPPAPQSMMGQFSSKMTNSAQKKHKCKVCDKRFTRPSSLQTHMYSHTGEKPFRCEVPGCGRNFSVVSNLRRHRKVHKDLTPSEAGSDDHHNSE